MNKILSSVHSCSIHDQRHCLAATSKGVDGRSKRQTPGAGEGDDNDSPLGANYTQSILALFRQTRDLLVQAHAEEGRLTQQQVREISRQVREVRFKALEEAAEYLGLEEEET